MPSSLLLEPQTQNTIHRATQSFFAENQDHKSQKTNFLIDVHSLHH